MGSLTSDLPEDQETIDADPEMMLGWNHFVKERSLPQFDPAMAWSFSAIFRETVDDVLRVQEQGCSVVEMEAATLYAIGKERGTDAHPIRHQRFDHPRRLGSSDQRASGQK